MAASSATQRATAILLGAGALVFVLLLAGVGSDAMTNEPEADSGYAVDTRGGTTPPGTTTGGAAQFVISRVAFAEGVVEIRNVGGAAGSLDGFWLCQRPSYVALAGTVAAGESLTFDGAELGGLDAADGEMGLYTSPSFGDSAAIVSYLEWGRAGHGRASVAAGAGIWPAGDFVAGGATSLVADGVATAAADWTVE